MIIDEAQHLSKETLQELGKLSECLDAMTSGGFKIVFVGQPEFENMLNSPNLKIINQQISDQTRNYGLDRRRVARIY